MNTIRLGQLSGIPENSDYGMISCICVKCDSANTMKSEYDSLKLNLIKEEIYKIVSQIKQVGMIQEYSLGHEWCELIAQSISDNIANILKICPAETERKLIWITKINQEW